MNSRRTHDKRSFESIQHSSADKGSPRPSRCTAGTLAALGREDAPAAADAALAVAATFPEVDVEAVVEAAHAFAPEEAARVGGSVDAQGEDPVASRLSVVPNPAGGTAGESVRVSFDVSEAGPISVVVFDALGRQVAVVADGTHTAGPHTVTVPLAARPAGVYVVRLRAATGSGTSTAVQRFSIVR